MGLQLTQAAIEEEHVRDSSSFVDFQKVGTPAS
jgi:hypothetical protein